MVTQSTQYVSVDIEADGPCPGPYSMLSLGAALFNGQSEEPMSAFTVNLERLPDAKQHPETMSFWARFPQAYEATRVNALLPDIAMYRFVDWLMEWTVRPVFVGYPAAYDSLFVFWYLHNFGCKKNPFGWQALDLKTLGMALTGSLYNQAVKSNFPKRWFGDQQHTHQALDDAIEQGVMFTRMLKEVKR